MKLQFFFAAALAALAFAGCTKEDKDTMGEAALMFDYQVNGQPFAYNQTYNVGGTAVSFETVHFYVGGLELHPEEGEHVHFHDKYLLVKPDLGALPLGEIEKGHYHELKFFVGVSPEDNAQTTEDFTNRPATDPLSLQNPRMSWSWNAGYIFVRVDGLTDTDGDGTPETAMQFHIGTNNMLRELSFNLHNDLMDEKNELHLHFDVAKLFTGINLSTDYICHTGNAPDLAVTFADNIASAIKAHD